MPTYNPRIEQAAGGAFKVGVTVDWHSAEVHGAMFFDLFAKHLEQEFRRVMVVCLRTAQKFAPKGDRNFEIEDLDEVTRAGGSKTSRPANPRGFAIDTDQAALRATGRGGYRIKKVPGGTLRRALALMVTARAGELIEGTIGVRKGSPAEAYARITELGGTIQAKRAKYLRYSPDGHTIVFKPLVHHPAHPYVLPALLYTWPLIEACPAVAFAKASAEFKGITGLSL